MVARVRPDPAGLQPTPAAPPGINGQLFAPDEHGLRPVVDAAQPPEAALSSLGPFAGLIGGPSQRQKVAALRALGALEPTSWSLVRAEAALGWLDVAEATSLIDELRTDGLLVPGADGTWRLSEEAQLVTTVLAVLATPRIDPERVVRVLGAVTSMALAAGTAPRPAVAPLLAALDLLDGDLETLLRLIEAGDDRALRASAWLARVRATDLGELLERERKALERLDLAPAARARLRRAPRLVRLVRELAEEVEATFAIPASELPPGSLELSEGAVRRLVDTAGTASLAAMVVPGLPRPPGVAAAGPGDALAALREWLERPEPEAPPLPRPRHLQVEPIDVVPDFVELAAQALTWLAGLDDATLDKWVVGGTWSQASARMAAAVEAWSRWGPAGDSSLAADLDPHPRLEIVGHDEVAVTTRTEVRRPISEPAGEDEPRAGATAEPDPPDPTAPQEQPIT